MVAPLERVVELVVRILEVVEAVLPQAHVFEGREGFLERLHPVGAAERDDEEQPPDVREHRPMDQLICNGQNWAWEN